MSENPPPPGQTPAPEGALPVSVVISVCNNEATLGADDEVGDPADGPGTVLTGARAA